MESQPDLDPFSNRLEDRGERRISVDKTYKMYIGGRFVRSESGACSQVKLFGLGEGNSPSSVNVPLASRKDLRDAVFAAKQAQGSWAACSPYHRAQVLYRLSEMMESRRTSLCESLVRSGSALEDAKKEISQATDLCMYYAGFPDKLGALLGSHNSVHIPYLAYSFPEAMGVVFVLAPAFGSLLGLVCASLPVVLSGNTVVVLVSEIAPCPALEWSECLATSDIPFGVFNLLSGNVGDVLLHMAKHRGVSAISAWLNPSQEKLYEGPLRAFGSDSVKRIKVYNALECFGIHEPNFSDNTSARAWAKRTKVPHGLSYIEPFLELKSVWHPARV